MKCEYCGNAIPDGAKECPACGAGIEFQTPPPAAGENTSGRLTIKCRKCGTENDSTMKFCGHCGEELDQEPFPFSEFDFQCSFAVSLVMSWVAYEVLTACSGVPHDLLDWVLTVIIVVATFFVSLAICAILSCEIRKKTNNKEM